MEWVTILPFFNLGFAEKVILPSHNVELFLNGKSLGKKKANRDNEWKVTYKVPYQAGELKAVGFEEEQQKSTFVLKTADEPSKIVLTADRTAINADGQDLSFITVEVQDENGLRNPKSQNKINFEIEGPGEIVAVGSSNPRTTESFQKSFRKAWQGRCLVIVKSSREAGKVTVSASSDGLNAETIEILTK